MKRRVIVAIVFAYSVIIFCCIPAFGFGKKKQKQNSNQTQYEKEQEEHEQQKKKNAGSAVGRKLKAGGGAAGGAAAGGAIGGTIGSVIPGPGTIIGAGIGAAVGGAFGGTAVSSIANGEVSEYINVETCLNYTNNTTGRSIPYVYNSLGQRNMNNVTPTFSKGDDCKLVVEMKATMIPEKCKKASKRQKSFDLLIPVEICFNKKDIKDGTLGIVNDEGSIAGNQVNHEEVDGVDHYFFFIKNDPHQTPTIVFKFVPAGVGEAKIRIIYGKPDYKIVLSSCYINQTIRFTE